MTFVTSCTRRTLFSGRNTSSLSWSSCPSTYSDTDDDDSDNNDDNDCNNDDDDDDNYGNNDDDDDDDGFDLCQGAL